MHTRTNNNNNNNKNNTNSKRTKLNCERVYYFNDGLLGFEVCVWYLATKTQFHSQT